MAKFLNNYMIKNKFLNCCNIVTKNKSLELLSYTFLNNNSEFKHGYFPCELQNKKSSIIGVHNNTVILDYNINIIMNNDITNNNIVTQRNSNNDRNKLVIDNKIKNDNQDEIKHKNKMKLRKNKYLNPIKNNKSNIDIAIINQNKYKTQYKNLNIDNNKKKKKRTIKKQFNQQQ